jgi:hypothetical protein
MKNEEKGYKKKMKYWFKRFFGSTVRQISFIFLFLSFGYLVVSATRVVTVGFTCLNLTDLIVLGLFLFAIVTLWLFWGFGFSKK